MLNAVLPAHTADLDALKQGQVVAAARISELSSKVAVLEDARTNEQRRPATWWAAVSAITAVAAVVVAIVAIVASRG